MVQTHGASVMAALGILAFYVAVYPIKGYRSGIGFDLPVYTWWARRAAAVGLSASYTGSRPGTVGSLAALGSVTHMPTAAVAEVLGPVIGAALALAVAAVGRQLLSADRPTMIAIALVTGGFLSLLVRGYLSTLTFGALLVAAVSALGMSIGTGGRGSLVAGAVTIGAAGLAHPVFLVLGAVLILGGLVAIAPDARRRRADGDPWIRVPLLRVAVAVLGGTGLTLVGLAVARAGPSAGPDTSLDAVIRRLRLGSIASAWRGYLPVDLTIFIATAVVIAILFRSGRPQTVERDEGNLGAPERSWIRGIGVSWLIVTIGGIIALILGFAVPGQRLAAFCLPLPFLAGVGVIRSWKIRRNVDVAEAYLLTAVPLCLLIPFSAFVWWHPSPSATPAMSTEARAAAEYLSGEPPGTPMIVVIDPSGEGTAETAVVVGNLMRSAVAGSRVPAVHVFLGSPRDLMAGMPAIQGSAAHDRVAIDYWSRVEPLLHERPLVLVIDGFDPASYREAQTIAGRKIIATGVVALPGFDTTARSTGVSRSRGSSPVDPGSGPLSPWLPVWLAPLVLAILTLIGWPWARVALDGRDGTLVGLVTPAFGLAALGLSSIVVDTVGLRLGGVGGEVAAVAAFASGALALGSIRSETRIIGGGRSRTRPAAFIP